MDALDTALAAHAATGPAVDPLDAALITHAASTPEAAAKVAPVAQKVAPSLWSTFTNAIPKGAAGFADAVPNALVNVANLGIAAYGMGKHAVTGKAEDLPELLPSDSWSGYSKMGRASGLIDDSSDPTTTAGRYVDFAGQVVGGGGINPMAVGRAFLRNSYRPVARDLTAAGASAAGGATGQELTRNVNTGSDSLDNLVKAVATFGGGMAAGGATASRGTAGDRVAAATKGVSPEQWAGAKARAQAAERVGSPITGYEALQAETGLNPKMQTQQRVIEQSDAAGPSGLTTLMQERPSANQALMDATAASISPPNNFPDSLAGNLQRAAGKAIQSARDEGNANAAPFYAKSSNDPAVRISGGDWDQLSTNPAVADALARVKRDPLLGLQNAQPGNVAWLDAAKKDLDARGAKFAMYGDNQRAAATGKAADAITLTVDPLVPAYAKAREVYAENMANNVDPMERGQVGKLSRSDSFPQQAQALLPSAPMDVTPAVVNRTISTINAQDPNIARQFVAQYLRGQYNEAAQQNVAGPNVFGGSKFAAQVAGNPAQEQNLTAALNASGASPQQLVEALQVFRAQGMKPPVNSATTANVAEGAAINGGLTGFMRNPISNTFGGLVDKWKNGGAASDLARALASRGMSVDDLQTLSRANGAYDPVQQQLLANLLMSSPARSTSP